MSRPTISDDPLPLEELSSVLSPNTYQWLTTTSHNAEDDDEQDDQAAAAARLFGESSSGGSDDQEGDDDDIPRVEYWNSGSDSSQGANGSSSILQVAYILSISSGGHGDSVWPAAKCLSSQLADPEQCQQVLRDKSLQSSSFLELGAGSGLVSWAALCLGAPIVVCTDQAIPHRIQCLAESAIRNQRQFCSKLSAKLSERQRVQVSPYDWGSPTADLFAVFDAEEQQAGEGFDIIVAADCVYMPDCHDILLESIHKLLSKDGIALLPFALHGNTPDEKVWNIREKASQKGFLVETLEAIQVKELAEGMDSKRGLVHTLRLSFMM